MFTDIENMIRKGWQRLLHIIVNISNARELTLKNAGLRG
jgi:hypothetical protein